MKKNQGVHKHSLICYRPMQLVAPRAVTIAVAILAIICTMNFNVSFFVIMVKV